MAVTSKQTFILGVGCQKAGTTWLWDYLDSHEAVTFAHPKEMHIFDAMLRPDLHREFYLHAKVQHLEETQSRGLFSRRPKRQATFADPSQRLEMMRNPQAYVDFFRSLDPQAGAVGEITPSYSTLYPEHFRFIRDLLEPHFDLRIVLLLRDPVARAFSAAKHFKRAFIKAHPVALEVEENAYLESLLASSYILERQDYARVLDALDEAFDPAQVHVDFYERLFTPEAVLRITEFLGLSPLEADFGKRVNPGLAGASALNLELAAQARAIYADTYTYCEERFGKALIEELWMPAA